MYFKKLIYCRLMNRSEVKLSKHLYPCQRVLANPWIKESQGCFQLYISLRGASCNCKSGWSSFRMSQCHGLFPLLTAAAPGKHTVLQLPVWSCLSCWAGGSNSAAGRGASSGRQEAAAFTAVGLQLSPIAFREQAGSDLTAVSQSILKNPNLLICMLF